MTLLDSSSHFHVLGGGRFRTQVPDTDGACSPPFPVPFPFLCPLSSPFRLRRKNYCREREFASPVCLVTRSRCLSRPRCPKGVIWKRWVYLPVYFLLLFLLAFPCFISQFASLLVWPSVLKTAFGGVSLSPRLSYLRACLGPDDFIRERELVSPHLTNMSIQFLQTSWHCRATFLLDTQLESWTITSWNQVNIWTCNVSTHKHVDMQTWQHANISHYNKHSVVSVSTTPAKILRSLAAYFFTLSFNLTGTLSKETASQPPHLSHSLSPCLSGLSCLESFRKNSRF